MQYSPDNGITWQNIANNISTNSITINEQALVGGQQALFRVLVTDGIHTTSDQTDTAFSAPNHAPTAEIVLPQTNLTVAVSQTLALEGYAYDPDTGTMDDSQLRWTSNLDGALGTYAQLSTASLSPGTHTITFQAADGAGVVATDTVQVTVVSDPTQLPAAADDLLVGPAQIVLDTATSTTSATLSIANQNGVNAIAWNATTDQAWVQLSKASGATPEEIVVTVSPAALPKGINTATITFTSPQVSGQSVTAQVLAQNGEADVALNNKVYLPMINK